jgi:hypothetical protein
METIIPKIYQLLKETRDFISFEEQLRRLMFDTFAYVMGIVLGQLDEAIVNEKRKEGWKRERRDQKTLTFTFGAVTYKRSLMYDNEENPHYPLDEWLGLRQYQRYSAMVELKTAELARETTYREVARVFREWTAVEISHTTVGQMVKEVGGAQAEADEEFIKALEESAALPEGKPMDFLIAEADGIFVRSTKKRKHIEVHHGVLYEGWETNGQCVSLRDSTVILTTRSTDVFWNQVQAEAANKYALEDTQVVTNSDGGKGYTADKFQEAFSQSKHEVLNSLDPYHIAQALNRTFGVKNSWKTKVKKAIKHHDHDQLVVLLDTYESRLEDAKQIEKLKDFRSYILGNWPRIFDWRDRMDHAPKGARALGAMESNQRRVTFRMKKRGLHWSSEGAEAMVKIIQGMANRTLRNVYLKHQWRSVRKHREVKRVAKTAQILYQKTRSSIGVKHGRIPLNGPSSSALGQLIKGLQY